MGLFGGGNSKTTRNTTNADNRTINDFNGEYAGNNGTVDNSSSETYQEVDNSQRLDQEIDNSTYQEIDNSQRNDLSQRTDFNQEIDNSQRNDLSQRTDINQDYGDNANNSGFNNTGEYVAGSVIDAGSFDLANNAIDGFAGVANRALDTSSDIIDSGLGFALSAIEDTSGAIIENSNEAFAFGRESINEIGRNAEYAIDASLKNSEILQESFSDFAGDLTAASVAAQDAANNIVSENGALLDSQLATVTELAKNTALAGQDVVAESSRKMTLYVSIALGVGFIGFIFMGRNS